MPLSTACASIASSNVFEDPIDVLLTAHSRRRTKASHKVLGWLLADPETSYTHAQLQVALQIQNENNTEPNHAHLPAAALNPITLNRITDAQTVK